MSLRKAEELLDLATLVAGRYLGVTLDEVVERFAVSRRTAQRWMRVLEMRFPETRTSFDDEGRKRWTLPHSALGDLLTLSPDELAALDLAIRELDDMAEAEALKGLRDKILALIPRDRIRRIEPDRDALLEAQGLAARPGPKPRVDPSINQTVTEAIKAARRLLIDYTSHADTAARTRHIEPYGILLGIRRYLVARDLADPDGPLRNYRFEAISKAELARESFTRDPAFSLDDYAAKAFGAYHDEREFGPVVWRFTTPRAVEQARSYRFHPQQEMEDQPDGSLLVRFQACGHLEMAWHLYSWGDTVEVLEPAKLRAMVEGYRRGDFPALP